MFPMLDLLDAPQDIPFLSNLIQRESFTACCADREARTCAPLPRWRTKQPDSEGRSMAERELRQAVACGGSRVGCADGRFHAAPSFPLSDRDEPAAYQKQLRLHTARVRMLTDGMDAASAAFEVGYESPSQFSREYSRFFGQPPMRDIKARQLTGAASERDSL